MNDLSLYIALAALVMALAAAGLTLRTWWYIRKTQKLLRRRRQCELT